MKKFRPVVKGLSWRAFAAFDTMLVASVVMYFQTGHITSAVFSTVVGMVGMELLTKTFLFTVHEKMWERERVTADTAATPTANFRFDDHRQSLIAQMDRTYAANRGYAID